MLVMHPRRLELLLELSRLGSMRAVADSLGLTTSTVSAQLAVLAGEAGVTLLEPIGRRVRLTPAGQRLAGHAVTILAALEAARVDLDPAGEPVGSVRVASYASAIRDRLLPLVSELARRHPRVRLLIGEHEPTEALELLAVDRVDLAITYDYNLARHSPDPTTQAVGLGENRWGLGVPEDDVARAGTTAEVFSHYADQDWIVNSRNTADEEVVTTLAALADFAPRVAHRADSLEVVAQMILAGLGVGLLPAGQPTLPGVAVLDLSDPAVRMRSYATTRVGRAQWPPLTLVLGELAASRA